MASIRKRGAAWRAEVRRGDFYRSKDFATKAEAQAWATSTEAEFLAGKSGKVAAKRLFEVFQRYAAEVSPTKGGERWEQLRLAKLADQPFSRNMLSELNAQTFAAWRDGRLKGTLKDGEGNPLPPVSGATVRREMNLIRSCLEMARKEWLWLHANPMTDVAKPPDAKPRNRRVSDEEAARICEALGWADGEPVGTFKQRTAVAFLLAIETGMRAGEILSLTPDRVFLPAQYCRLLDTKNGDHRDVALSSRAVRLLESVLPDLFPMSSASLDATFRKGRDAAGVKGLTFHDSRHEACTRLAKRLSVLELARQIGHRDVKSLMIYFNPTASELASKLG